MERERQWWLHLSNKKHINELPHKTSKQTKKKLFKELVVAIEEKKQGKEGNQKEIKKRKKKKKRRKQKVRKLFSELFFP
jgi:hypothetical protein